MIQENPPEREHWLDRRVLGLTLEQALYALFVLLAMASRFALLGDRAQSHDESLHTRYSWELYDGQGFSHTPMMHGPLGFHLVALTFWLFGDSDASSRAPVALLGVILVMIPYLLRRWLGRTGALAASFLMLVSPSLLYYSRYIRWDIPVILWAMVVVVAMWRYLTHRKEKHLLWFAGGLSAMFATKEVCFLYVAIFGSFVALRMAVGLLSQPWKHEEMRSWLKMGLLALLLGALIFGVGMAGQALGKQAAAAATLSPDATAVSAEQARSPGEAWAIVRLVGGVIAGLALVLIMSSAVMGLKEHLRDYPEFDLIVLFSTLLLPFMAPIPIEAIGGNSLDYTLTGVSRSAIVFVPMLAASVAVGLLWNWRAWLRAAGVFYAIFAVLYTTVFTNGYGFASGWFGSLGYWMAQQEVQRGDQPWYFYLFVVPIYEFLPMWAAAAGVLYWAVRRRGLVLIGELLARRGGIAESDRLELFGFIPFLIWWTAGTWFLYSYAGEKMGWLTTHFAVPMVLLAGWFLNWLLKSTDWSRLWRDGGWGLWLMAPLILAAVWLGVRPVLFGEVRLGSEYLEDLKMLGRLLAGVLVAVGAGVALVTAVRRLDGQRLLRAAALGFFTLLAVLTVRVAWMASYINYDTAREYIVYAHGAPGARQALDEIEALSMRLYGDLSIRVAFDNKVSWPFWWYLRDYPNKVYFGENPSRDSLDAPVVLVGAVNWPKVEPYVGDRYHVFKYTYLWWPMEDYKRLTWDRVWGAMTDPVMRQALWDILFNRDYTAYAQATGRDFSLSGWPLRDELRLYVRKDVAAQLWDYGVAPTVAQAAVVDPYEDGFLAGLWPIRVVGGPGEDEGQLRSPRGVDLGQDGLLYVVDSGNNRVQVFDVDGQVVRAWGSYCNVAEGGFGCLDPDGGGPLPLGAGQFNEPWGIAVAPDGTVYVADTWNHRIQRFSSEGEFLNAWGTLGQVSGGQSAGALGFFYGPRDVAISPDGLVYVSDTGNKRVQVFQADGLYVGEFGEEGPLDGQMDEPVGLAFDPSGVLLVADTWNGRVQQFDRSHTFLRKWVMEAWYGQSVNNKPFLATDGSGWVYITDPEMFRVLVFDGLGNYHWGFGQYSAGLDGLALPTGIVVGPDGTIWVTDAGNNRVLGYAHP
jgi:uncharacterized protein (TIGR03663 family)